MSTARQLTRRGEARRRQIVEHAARKFAEAGYDATSVTDLVSSLGVGKGVFYWYFSSKDELFREILTDALVGLRRRQQRAIEGESDPLARIELGIRASLAWLDEHRELLTLLQFASGDERFASLVRAGQDVAVRDAAVHVSEAIAHGRIRRDDPSLLAHAILGVTNHLAQVLIVQQGLPLERVSDLAVLFCRGGLTYMADEHASLPKPPPTQEGSAQPSL
jgi:AcrR family transcriptional regulator